MNEYCEKCLCSECPNECDPATRIDDVCRYCFQYDNDVEVMMKWMSGAKYCCGLEGE